MATPDVRIRLKADGTQEVLDAFRAMQTGSQKAGKGIEVAFSGVHRSLDGLRELLAALGVGLSIGAFVGFVKHSADAAEELDKLQQKMGGTIEGLAAIAAVAAKVDVDVAKLGSSIGIFAKQTVALVNGSDNGAGALSRLGFRAEQFKGKNLSEQLSIVARKFAEFPAGADKAAAAVAVFGKRGIELIPLLNEMARLTPQAAAAMGKLFDSEAVRSAAEFNDALKQTGLIVQGLGVQFAAGLSGPVVAALQALEGELDPNAIKATQRFGFEAGRVIAIMLLQVAGLADSWDNLGKRVQIQARAMGEAALAITRQQFFLLGAISENANEQIEQNRKLLAARDADRKRQIDAFKAEFSALPEPVAPELVDKSIAALRKLRDEERANLRSGDELAARRLQQIDAALKAANKRGGGTGEVPADESRIAADRLQTRKAALDAEAKLITLNAKLEQDAARRAFEAGITSLADYYATRRDIVQRAAAGEISVLRRRRDEEAKQPKSPQRTAALAAIDADITAAIRNGQNDVANLEAERTEAQRKLADQRLAIEQEIMLAQGRRHEVEMQRIAKEVAAFDELQTKAGVDPVTAGASDQSRREFLDLRENARQAQDDAARALAKFEADVASINAAVASRSISAADGRQKLLDLYKQEQPELAKLVKLALDFAEAIGPEAVAAVQALAAKVDEIHPPLSASQQAMADLGQRSRDLIATGLGDLFANVGKGADALRSSIASLIDSFVQLISNALALKVLGSLFPKFFAGGGQVKSGGGVIRRARGGLIRGPGSGTSDSISTLMPVGAYVVRAAAVRQRGVLGYLQHLAAGGQPTRAPLSPVRVSTGEFWLDPSIVRRPGMLRDLKRINFGMPVPELRTFRGAHQFAGGGMVSGSGASSPGRRDRTDIHLTVHAEEGTQVTDVQSREGEDVVLSIVQRNRRRLGL